MRSRIALLAGVATLLAALVAAASPAALAAGGGYPYAAVRPAAGAADPWGFGIRQCTSFVAWRLHQHGVALTDSGFRGPDGRAAVWGDARNWAAAARADGYPVGSVAEVGAVAQWGAGESAPYYPPGSALPHGTATAGPDGHVAWVVKVYPDGSALVDQYNGGGGDLEYSEIRVRAPRYLYIAVPAPAR